jgi:hypothetical protein
MKESVGLRGEPVISLMCGVPSLTIGLGSLVLLASYLIHRPIGPPSLYEVEWFRARPSSPTFVSLVLPSGDLLLMLAAGLWCGGFGIYFARCRRPYRRATTSIVGMTTCATAFVLTWLLITRAATW